MLEATHATSERSHVTRVHIHMPHHPSHYVACVTPIAAFLQTSSACPPPPCRNTCLVKTVGCLSSAAARTCSGCSSCPRTCPSSTKWRSTCSTRWATCAPPLTLQPFSPYFTTACMHRTAPQLHLHLQPPQSNGAHRVTCHNTLHVTCHMPHTHITRHTRMSHVTHAHHVSHTHVTWHTLIPHCRYSHPYGYAEDWMDSLHEKKREKKVQMQRVAHNVTCHVSRVTHNMNDMWHTGAAAGESCSAACSQQEGNCAEDSEADE